MFGYGRLPALTNRYKSNSILTNIDTFAKKKTTIKHGYDRNGDTEITFTIYSDRLVTNQIYNNNNKFTSSLFITKMTTFSYRYSIVKYVMHLAVL